MVSVGELGRVGDYIYFPAYIPINRTHPEQPEEHNQNAPETPILASLRAISDFDDMRPPRNWVPYLFTVCSTYVLLVLYMYITTRAIIILLPLDR